MKLSDKVSVVTGAGSGIGQAIAVRFAQEGAHVVIADANLEAAEQTYALIKDTSPQSKAYQVDVAQEKQIERLISWTKSQFGRIDILVNNAGIGVAAPVAETTVEDWDRVMAVNARGVFLGCKFVVPIMEEQGKGVIVNIASVAGEVGVYNRAVYCASKGAVIALTKSVAIDYAEKGIRAVAVSPGTVESPWIGKILSNNPDPESARKAMEARQPIGRMGTPEEIANAVCFLASDEASFVTGSNMIVDGGLMAR
ncbi:NAD(P)-dependent dehydrogenase (short-subunit alcohol dehydrogenase family) [Caldalkalibacillus uzonensis]|uniref:NAD(P)-dependent dehydrogenase (Short-subunit alcohol dehydrogenase family) n=1 Tax=Caldalkalibacillus uzonensis TaxID=353224 RepID=A0ABU0CTB9_9BACI|nr:SDR family oxidoreductase [Caldalkalibacillus uzonensis]MDQ0338282.1 NAD(P)-dependent dehydrogenase (short-subunit alcohol dehydrogenase family) [Caldalkalibacillus uzonensis]